MPAPSNANNDSSENMKDDKSRLSRPPYSTSPSFKATYSGHCFCGAITFELQGPPKANVYCHCRSCQRLHGAPASLTSIYDKQNVQFTKGQQDDMVFYSPQERKTEYKLPLKISCKACHSPVGNEGNGMMLILPSLIDFSETQGEHGRLPDAFKPTFHQYYGTRIRDIQDDLPKFSGKKNEGPLNRAGEEKIEKDEKEKKRKEEEEQKKEEDGKRHKSE